MFRIVVIGAVLAAGMISVKDHRVLERTHIVGSCAIVAQAPDGSEWRSCIPGRMTGRPGLTMDGCSDYGRYRQTEYWACPASLTSVSPQ